MRSVPKLLAALAVALAAAGAQAQTFGTTNTYSNLWWSFSPSSGSPFSGCSWLQMDATGDFTHSDQYAMYGNLQCSTGSYAVDGMAYFVGSSFNMTVSIGPAHKLVCINLPDSTMSGSCTVYTNGGVATSTAFISF
jgi:hypothetical protein